MQWDADDTPATASSVSAAFPPTAWQISGLHAGTDGATNVIPGNMTVNFNFRFSPVHSVAFLIQRVKDVLTAHHLQEERDYCIAWKQSPPFFTPPGTLSDALVSAIRAETGVDAKLSTTGGTSDGRFITRICNQVIEFGPPNATIHQANEYTDCRFINPLKNIYRKILEQLIA